MTTKMEEIVKEGQIQRFDIKTESKVLKAINKILDEVKDPINENDAINTEPLFTMNTEQTMLIRAISEQAKRCLSRFCDKENREYGHKYPKEIDYNGEKFEIKSRYGSEYLIKIMRLMNDSGDSVKLQTKHDYPLKAFNEHFEVILAPRCDTD